MNTYFFSTTIMALELGESVLEDLLGVEDSNSTEGDDVVHMGDCLKSSLGDEFFHSKEEFGVSTSFEQFPIQTVVMIL